MDHSEYIRQREQLIREDRAKRIDYNNSHQPSDLERAADGLVRDIRAREAVTVWGAETTTKPAYGSQQMFPGMEFLTSEHFFQLKYELVMRRTFIWSWSNAARETIVRTTTFAILSKVRPRV